MIVMNQKQNRHPSCGLWITNPFTMGPTFRPALIAKLQMAARVPLSCTWNCFKAECEDGKERKLTKNTSPIAAVTSASKGASPMPWKTRDAVNELMSFDTALQIQHSVSSIEARRKTGRRPNLTEKTDYVWISRANGGKASTHTCKIMEHPSDNMSVLFVAETT